MLLKLAFKAGGTFDQMVSSSPTHAAYAHLTKDKKKDMHHGKAMGIGAGVGAGFGLAAGGFGLNQASKLKAKPFYKRFSKHDRDLATIVKKFKSVPKTHKLAALGILAATGAGIGALSGLGHNATTRTLRAAQRGQRDVVKTAGFLNNALATASKGAVGLAKSVAAPLQATQTAVKSFTPKVTPAMGFAKPGVGQAGFIAKKRGLLG